jgi:MarR family transcriptional regulator for hemolysin
MKTQELPFGMVVGRMRHEMFRVLRKYFNEQTKEQLAIQQFGLLHSISCEGNDAIQKRMADKMGQDKSAIMRLVNSLESKKLIKRVVDPKDRRKNRLILTQKGKKVVKEYLEIEFNLVTILQRGLTESEIKVFFKVVNKIKENAEKL